MTIEENIDVMHHATLKNTAHYLRIVKASEYQNTGNLSQARDIYVELLQENPDDANAMHLLGMLAHQAGDSEQGISLINNAIGLIPDFPLYLNNLGQIYLSLQQLDKAEELFLKATRIDTEMAAPLYGLAECYRRGGDLQRAANYLEYVLEREPEHVDAIVSLGQIHLQNRAASKALALFEIAISIDAEHIDAKFNAARALFSLSQHEESIAILQALLKQNPEFYGCYNNLGNAYLLLAKYDEAIEAYQKVIGATPDDADMRYNLAVALVRTGDMSAAILHLKHGLKLTPEHGRIQVLLENIQAPANDQIN